MATTPIPAALGLTEALPAGRPTHIVVFWRARSGNVATLTKALGQVEKPISVEGRPGVLAAPVSSPAPFSYYSRFGVAAVTLDEAQRRELATHSEVEGVYANLMRSIPRPVSPTARIPQLPAPGMAAPLFQPPTAAASSAEAYLMGMIDAASGALRALRLDASLPPASNADTAAARAKLSWGLRAIGITAKTRWTGKGIKVAVLDTGVDRNHPDLQGRIVAYKNFAAGSSDNDIVEHGTHCAGVIAGSARPRGGVRYGVAPGVSLIVAKVLGDDGRGWDNDIIEAMDWAVDQGARVLSMSLGAPRAVNQPASASYEQLAANFAQSTPSVLIVAAAGNESQRPDFLKPVGNPAACASIMAVAAIDEQRMVADFSCAALDAVGGVDIAAPGVEVVSAKPGGSVQLMSGTSMATPHVAGLAALYLQKKPSLTATELWKALQERCVPAGLASDVGSGLVQAP
jgi:subtilisin family serine protease